jgi:anti-sigma-K factor RskA
MKTRAQLLAEEYGGSLLSAEERKRLETLTKKCREHIANLNQQTREALAKEKETMDQLLDTLLSKYKK